MKIVSAAFATSASKLNQCPAFQIPEYAFIGRSNVGKSSLINMLTVHGDLAKTSRVPGKTQLINFFLINGSWHLVDLPGYGFAKVSQRTQASFNRSVGEYILRREQLRHLFVLVDATIEPQAIDFDFLIWLKLDSNRPYSLVLTKIDRISKQTLEQHQARLVEELANWNLPKPNIIPCSAKDRSGRSQLLACIDQTLPKKHNRKQQPALNLNWIKPSR